MATAAQKRTAKAVWEDRDSFATTLLILAVDKYGTEFLQWTPQTIREQIEMDFNVQLPRINHEKLMAAVHHLTSDDFWKSLPDFITLCNTLSGDLYDPNLWDPADAEEIAWGITEAILIDPPDEENPFTDDILAYIGAVMDQEGIINPPDVLALAIRKQDLVATIQSNFADDPEMFRAIYETEKTKTERINSLVRLQLHQLSTQLATLPVTEGDTSAVVESMLNGLRPDMENDPLMQLQARLNDSSMPPIQF